jgi:hypothetical protein
MFTNSRFLIEVKLSQTINEIMQAIDEPTPADSVDTLRKMGSPACQRTLGVIERAHKYLQPLGVRHGFFTLFSKSVCIFLWDVLPSMLTSTVPGPR